MQCLLRSSIAHGRTRFGLWRYARTFLFHGMNTQRATHLFQSDAALAIGQERAAKAARTAQGEEYGHPIWLGVGPSPLPSEDRDASDAPSSAPRDFASLAERAAGADGGLTKVIAATMPRPDQPQVWTAESGRMARHTHLEVRMPLSDLSVWRCYAPIKRARWPCLRCSFPCGI